jgi:hypothetical protein
MTFYNPTEYYKKKFEIGLKYQEFVKNIFENIFNQPLNFFYTKEEQQNGETKEGYEVKFNGMLAKKYKEDTVNENPFVITQTLLIETSEKTNKNYTNYTPSGIYKKNDNSKFYVTGNYDIIYIFEMDTLRKIGEVLKIINKPTGSFFLLHTVSYSIFDENENSYPEVKLKLINEILIERKKEKYNSIPIAENLAKYIFYVNENLLIINP